MSKHKFPHLALGLGLLLLLIVIAGSAERSDGTTALPLFTLLAVSEVAFFVTAFGAYIAVTHILSVGMTRVCLVLAISCALLSGLFVLLGLELWPL